MKRRREVCPDEESAAPTLHTPGFPYKSRAERTSVPCLENESDTGRAYFHVIANAYDNFFFFTLRTAPLLRSCDLFSQFRWLPVEKSDQPTPPPTGHTGPRTRKPSPERLYLESIITTIKVTIRYYNKRLFFKQMGYKAVSRCGSPTELRPVLDYMYT
ncbi:hypothetical protein AVEN_22808-1 [Araneus ventricosus]|uniref:Uncharacterized protein n=1 Tax=Araneus ventricosus TaxID=182803 RepID=A0A4Y2EBG2_ARAVE|nr:hypothetical protein AVEN_22808-1 [Araneus ventricosus]